jgi:aspartate aminotransferase
MNHLLSDKINNLATSQKLSNGRFGKRLKHRERDIIRLGEPDFNTPDIKEAAKAIDENYSTYSPVEGYGELKGNYAEKFKRDNN